MYAFAQFRVILSVIILMISALGIGSYIYRLILGTSVKSPQHFWLGYFYGQALLSTFFFLISWLIPTPINWYFGIGLIILGIWCFFNSFPEFKLFAAKKWSLPELFVMTTLSAVILFSVFYSFLKPTEWDEVSYHVPVMKELAQGNLRFPLLQASPYVAFYQPFSFFYGSLPYASESFASWGYLISGENESVAHLIYMVNFVIFLLIVNAFLLEFYKIGRLTRMVVCLAITLHGGILMLLTTGLVDVTTGILQVLSGLLLIQADKEKKRGYLWLSLFCLGAAFGHKFTTAFILPVYIPWFYLSARKLATLREQSLKGISWLFLGGGIWYFKNLLYFFNPVYPLYFGHKGMTDDQYLFLHNTLIQVLRVPINLSSFIKMISDQYKNEVGLIAFLIVLIFSFFFSKVRLKRTELILLLAGLSMFFMNFLLGSQLSRYVLLLPIIVYLLSAKYVDWSKILSIMLFAVLLLMQFTNIKAKSLWQARIHELTSIANATNKDNLGGSIGCVASIYEYCIENCSKPESVLNLWDAYAAVYYESSRIFITPKTTTFEDLELPNTVEYVYINFQWRDSLLRDAEPHRDMRPVARAKFEEKRMSIDDPIFTTDGCSLYKLITDPPNNTEMQPQ
ncbi:MAG: hypothetical protein COY80_04310 [Candidatus Pacebacteria bacterium CG_4_10_14_0_8_um_filter_42_14]|nr:MAG: hypothetical protein COY80_04310 [Candidatus Pacebacteria bacterium CG_4_10_14_0_8_um_filter_42_14]